MSTGSRHAQSATRADDRRFMRDAIAVAARIAARPWPNPPVGAVIVRDGEVVGAGAHQGAGRPHAEPIALAAAGPRARGATLYVTLEPCRHHGRTPPCTDAILAAGVGRVVAGISDLNPTAGGGAEILRNAGVEVTLGVRAAECLDLIWPFLASDRFARPYVELKTAAGLDGFLSWPRPPAGAPDYLTGLPARRDVHCRRRWVDLVLVGSGTARCDRPRLDTRLVPAAAACPQAEPAAGCVMTRPPADTAAGLARERWFCFHGADAAGLALPAGVEAVPCAIGPAGVDPAELLAACSERGFHTIMLEGGPRLAASFLAAGLVDRWVQYIAPVVTGGGAAWSAVVPTAGSKAGEPGPRFHLTRHDRIGADLRVIWDRRDFAAALLAAGGAESEDECSPV
ncbi:MAG: bifunctional diaminohydroxyphosphoribosylaminopyrimidine deaminase/5-amino-6-(5-phosphoribosylamino)uracil reductase RibD [Candidatus Krumholzibacteria bacterium]|nr:bifunctional diaminohydroxyphosphoribosylaminopyrimidine deaminase/5-amino-6-(5-phosphoribosylamino)uracil reductase RibD [Candidatus Krumholzibacteria bacterium]